MLKITKVSSCIKKNSLQGNKFIIPKKEKSSID